MVSGKHNVSRRIFIAGATAAALVPAGRARAAGEFVGKTITMIVGFPPGGGVDTGSRVIARHLPRFLDGNPNIVIQNMPGAGGVASANWLFAKAPRDGLTIGVPGRDWPLHPVLYGKSGRFEPLEFQFVGSTGAVNTYVWLKKSLGITTPEQLKASKRQIVFGGLSPSNQPSMAPKIMALNGYPVRAVSGYRGMGAIVVAMEKGEVDAVNTNVVSFAKRPDLMAQTVRIFQQLPSAEKLPVLRDYVDAESKLLLVLAGYASSIGMPLVAPPGTDAARLAALRAGFAKMSEDAQFGKDADKVGVPWGKAISGAEIRIVLKETIAAATPDRLKAFRAIAAR